MTIPQGYDVQGENLQPGSVADTSQVSAPMQNIQQVVNVHVGSNEPVISKHEKSFGTYFMCALFGGWLGVHHYYTGNIGKGLLYTFTGGLFFLGWLVDVINARRNFNREMASQGILSARTRS